MRKLDRDSYKKNLQICLFAAVVGLIITVMAWCLTHISFLLTWMFITVMTIPMWKEVAEWAMKRYPNWEILDAMMTYIFFPDSSPEEEDEEDEYIFQETIEN